MQEPQPLGRHLLDEKIDASRIAFRPGEAGDKTKPDRVFGDTEDDRDRRCRSFGRERSYYAARRGDHGHQFSTAGSTAFGIQRNSAETLNPHGGQAVTLDAINKAMPSGQRFTLEDLNNLLKSLQGPSPAY